MNIRCRLGLHRFGPWYEHEAVDGCVFAADRHQFRRCERCSKIRNRFLPRV